MRDASEKKTLQTGGASEVRIDNFIALHVALLELHLDPLGRVFVRVRTSVLREVLSQWLLADLLREDIALVQEQQLQLEACEISHKHTIFCWGYKNRPSKWFGSTWSCRSPRTERATR